MNTLRFIWVSAFRRTMLLPKHKFTVSKISCHLKRKPSTSFLISSLLPSLLTVTALTKKKNKILETADDLYDANKFVELHELLAPYKESSDPEILWRLARAKFETCRDKKNEEKLQELEKALFFVEKALEIKEECWAAHKWRAILLDYVWRYKSTKGRIVHSFDVRKHMERAIELNPKDGTTYYLLGEWCFTFADMPWYQRKVAATIFANPPTSSYEEALKYFQKAEEITPMFYSMNLLMLGKCLLKMNKKEEAIEYLKKAQGYPVKTSDDQQAQTEAAKILKDLKAN